MGMYRLEVSQMADQDRQTIIDLLMPQADDGRVFNGTVTGIGTISAFYENEDTAYALALDCETTVFCRAEVDYHPTDQPMREKRDQPASVPLTDEERRQYAPLNGNREFRLLK